MKLQHVIDVVTDGPVQPGSVAHARRVRYRSDAADGTNAVRQRLESWDVYPACQPQPAQDVTTTFREYSGGWALAAGVVPCPAEACFQDGAE
jgi:hypothetical protein